MIILDYRDTRPLYEQIVDKFQMLILSGALEPNSRMPSVRSLAVELSINPNTVQKTYRQLEQRGLIYSLPGKGSYVAERSQYSSAVLEKATEEFRKAVEDGVKSGLTGEMMKAAVDAVVNKEGKV